MAGEDQPAKRDRHIVSSAHLADNEFAEMSEFEFGLIIASNAFNRWVVRCMAASGVDDLSALDVLVLHSIHHRGRPKRLADLCLVLNVEDSHTVTYALKKLTRAGLVAGTKKGKEIHYTVTAKGRQACERYAETRVDCLLKSLRAVGLSTSELGLFADRLRALSGLYDQAARAAASR